MTMSISKRALVRIISFAVAIVVVLSALAIMYYRDANQQKRYLQYKYMQSIADLTNYVQNIDSGLNKVMYTKTPAMLTTLSSKLWRDAGFAKNSLGALPIEYLHLQNTNKLLSQVGDYCVTLSKEFSEGKPITQAERNNLKKLQEYCNTMLVEVAAVNDGLQNGKISLDKVEDNINHQYDRTQASPTVAEGFSDFEEGFTSYPTLIYDGPFSDNILQKEPERLKNEKTVTRAQAKAYAAKVAGVSESNLSDSSDEEGKMPSYCFSSKGVDVAVTKKGGLVSYMLKSRASKATKLSAKDATAAAVKYMKNLGVTNMTESYYEIRNNIMTINFAYAQNNITVYPDLIKVGVAMDNGEILSFDARGYITNHKARTGLTPAVTEQTARKSVSDLLAIKSARLCVIPSSGLNEVLCWEFACVSDNEQNVLVYINAKTGAEEQILMLMINDNGQLTI